MGCSSSPPSPRHKFSSCLLFVSLFKVPYEIVSVGNPVQVICKAQSSNATAQPVFSSSTPLISLTTTRQVTSSVNGISVTAASVSTSLSGSASVAGGSAKKRRRRSVGVLALQYWFNNSAGDHTHYPLVYLVPYSFLAVRDLM